MATKTTRTPARAAVRARGGWTFRLMDGVYGVGLFEALWLQRAVTWPWAAHTMASVAAAAGLS